jgi:uncharacterized protein with ParB-like and HNH nuclease domain
LSQFSNGLLVIDGQQRLRTLQFFYDGVFGPSRKVFALSGLGAQSQYERAQYASLSDDDRRKLDDTIIHATIIKQDKPSEDDSSVYLNRAGFAGGSNS